MSSCDDSEDDLDVDGEAEAGGGSASDAAPGGDEDGQVQRKLHLFRCASIQQSLRRLWEVLPRDERGELTMDGYVEFNLRLQKCLTQEFAIERAVDSAIGDWCEDVHEGQDSMTEQDFAMFLFELSSLWCGPTVSLRVYLLFLCSTFIAITEARGSHTVGLRPLETIERLPQSFFDLLSMQGWARLPEEEGGFTEAQVLAAWYQRNLSPEGEQAALLQVQRQIFQVTHDVRAVLLFRHLDGRREEEPTVLDLVKQATQQLEKVSKAERPKCLPPAPKPEGPTSRTSPRTELVALPWCPPSHARAPGGPGASAAARAAAGTEAAAAATALALAPQAAGTAQRRGRSAPGTQRRSGSLALAPAVSQQRQQQQAPPPLGRAFDTQRVAGARGRSLALAGQAAVGSKSPAGLEAPAQSLEEGPRAAPHSANSAVAGVDLHSSSFAATQSFNGEFYPGGSVEEEEAWQREQALHMADFLEAGQFLPPYTLPKSPADLYRQQVAPLMKATPSTLVFEANKWQACNRLVPEPFERVIQRLPAEAYVGPEGPRGGPLGNPGEPVWFEMNHRLQAILKKQGRRAERRRKRRLRSKLLTGRAAKGGGKKSEGRSLREYFDKAALERAEGQAGLPGVASGEFLGKVHEQYLQRRERFEQQRFQVRGTARDLAIGEEPPPRVGRVVRPVYCPPPGMRTERLH